VVNFIYEKLRYAKFIGTKGRKEKNTYYEIIECVKMHINLFPYNIMV